MDYIFGIYYGAVYQRRPSIYIFSTRENQEWFYFKVSLPWPF